VDATSRVLTIITSAGILQGVLLFVALLRKGGGRRQDSRRQDSRRRESRALAAIVAFFTVNIAIPEFLFASVGHPLHLYFLVIGAFPLVLGPLLLMYVDALEGSAAVGAGSRVAAGYAAQAIPFVAYAAGLAILGGMTESVRTSISASIAAIMDFAWFAIFIHAAIYLGIALFRLHRLGARLKARLSAVERYDFRWVSLFSAASIAAYAVIAVLVGTLSHGHPLLPADKTVSLVLSVMVYALGWRGLFQESVPAGIPAERPKYARSGLNSVDSERLLRDLRNLMEEEKPYLDPALSLNALASEAGMQPGELSRAVNEAAGSNFYDFVNSYRIEEAKRLLRDQAHRDRSVLDIAFGAGFRSKSTFNACFRKFTGLTPLSFRRKSPPA